MNNQDILEYAKRQARNYAHLAIEQQKINDQHDQRWPLLKGKNRYELLMAERLDATARAYADIVDKLTPM